MAEHIYFINLNTKTFFRSFPYDLKRHKIKLIHQIQLIIQNEQKTVNGKGGREHFHILSQVTHEIRIPLHTLRVLMKSSISFHNLR